MSTYTTENFSNTRIHDTRKFGMHQNSSAKESHKSYANRRNNMSVTEREAFALVARCETESD